jgi:uncharacterized SAM-dependent methyltransferase
MTSFKGSRHDPVRYHRAGSTIVADPNCSKRSPSCPEYYPSRTERSILQNAAHEIASSTGDQRTIVEFGSGSSAKTSILLSVLAPSAYVPIDICGEFLHESAARLSQAFADLPIYPIEDDFTDTVVLA